ncbi:hypothetical protein GF361_03385 [Candidatus Woesearchaeota archaeon]|nr:hypothetical protein [Candidatus Woesearchaeota archaeon]
MEDDEEISIDLSKIKKFFKRKKASSKAENAEKKVEEEIDEEKIKIKELKKEEIEEEKRLKKLEDSEEVIEKEKKKIKDLEEKEEEIKKQEEREEKKIEKEEEKVEKVEEEISFDIKKVFGFFKGNKWAIPVLLILIAVFFSVFFRMYPSDLPVTEEWAENSVYNFYKNQIKNDIDKQYPNLPDANKQSLIQNQFIEFLNENENRLEKEIEATAESFKERMKDEDGNTYLLAIDPYYYMRHVRHYIEDGQAGTTYVGGEYGVSEDIELYYEGRGSNINFNKKQDWDGQRMAPIGSPSSMSFHSYFSAYLYKFISIFNKDVSLMGVMFLVPVIISALAVLPAFFIGKRIGGNVGGFFAGMMVAVNSAFLGRTAGGFSDTDAYNVLFPLLAVWLFLEAFEAENWKKKIGLTCLSGLSIGLFAFAWSGWWYIFDAILGAIGIYLIYGIFINRNKIKENWLKLFKQPKVKNTLIILIVFILFSGLFISLFKDFSGFYEGFFNKPIKIMTGLKTVGVTSIWPNIRTTVAELNAASIKTIANQIGGKFLFAFSLLGLLLVLTKKDKTGERYVKQFTLLAVWFIGTIYASTQGVRFVLLLVPAFSIAFGAGAGIIYQSASKWVNNEMKIPKKVINIVLILVLLLLLAGPISSANKTAKNEIPSMNDAWYGTLIEIKEESSEDAIINSWWDFGHWFITLADRKVTFDGAGQDKHMAHWIGKSLLENDEEKTMGILRMVDCGNNNAFWALDEILNDTLKSIEILNEIIVMNEKDAKEYLRDYIEEVEDVIQYTHCEPPENYYITSEDMVGKSGVWAHFGSWDFERAYIYNKLRKVKDSEKGVEIIKNKFNYSEEKAEEYYYDVQAITSTRQADSWIAPWPSYAGEGRCAEGEEGLVVCNNGIKLDLKNDEAWIDSSEGKIYPKKIAIPEKEDILVKEFEGQILTTNNNVELGAVFVPIGNGNYKMVLMDEALVESTFTKLFYLQGHSSKYFDLFSERKQISGGQIYVWKLDWDGNSKNNIFDGDEKEEIVQNLEIQTNSTDNLINSTS